MSPIVTRPIGITPQIIDDDRLIRLRISLEEIELTLTDRSSTSMSVGDEVPDLPLLEVEKFLSLLEPWQDWPFEELVDLQEWVGPLNRIDACLAFYVRKYPSLLLVGHVERSKSKGARTNIPKQDVMSYPAKSLEEVKNVPGAVCNNILVLLKFLSGLLVNSSSKHIFNSVDEVADLLGAADDRIALAALTTLCSLSVPPPLHKQQVPEFQQHSTALHSSSSTAIHRRILALARGWGTRGNGLGLYDCVTADDSEFGQSSLPPEAGELQFTFMMKQSESEQSQSSDVNDRSLIRHVSLSRGDILDDSAMSVETPQPKNADSNLEGKQKRRRVLPASQRDMAIRSSADLFFRCIERAGGRQCIPDDCLFRLLADVRLARSFHCQSSRVSAVNARLVALNIALNCHPSQEVLTGYFQAQPELCVELVDLLRPTVSSNAVSTTNLSGGAEVDEGYVVRDALSTLASSLVVPYETRALALDALTALVSRRDNTNGALTGVAKQSNVLSELGVGKGQYLGLLPTLLRYSLASLGTLFLADGRSKTIVLSPENSHDDVVSFDIALAFAEATAPLPLPRFVQVEMALRFIDSVLSLTAAVVSTQSGTAALTECGLVPALLNTIGVDVEDAVWRIQLGAAFSDSEIQTIKAMLRFIAAQAVQILEGSIVTHINAFSALQNLKGVEILTDRLSKEILRVPVLRYDGVVPMDIDNPNLTSTIESRGDSASQLCASKRVLIFGVVTCLTVIFHQESTSSTRASSSGATEVQKPFVTKSLIEIMDNCEVYGGSLCSLVATLLADVMNSDPSVVRYIHGSGLAKSFLRMIELAPDGNPRSPSSAEFIGSVCSVIAALSLTEDGAKAIKDANPFPSLLKILHHPKYAMPQSRCLLNDLSSVVGSGCEEIMRHVPSLKVLICSALCDAMKEVASFGVSLMEAEEKLMGLQQSGFEVVKLQSDRTCLMQYSLNFGQVLEQILHSDDQCEAFVKAGGVDAILDLYSYLMPGESFLAQISCMSSPSLSTLNHSTTEDALTGAFRCIALRQNPTGLLSKIVQRLSDQLLRIQKYDNALRSSFSSVSNDPVSVDSLDATFILKNVPRNLLVDVTDPKLQNSKKVLAIYLREVNSLHWLTSLLAAVIKGASSREVEGGAMWRGRTEREWRKELASVEFQNLLGRLSSFYQSATLEACRVRSEDEAEECENSRQLGDRSKNLRYKLKVVCPEGAVVRNGIDIDTCASLGSLEMGEIVEAYDRCLNSSGVMRYRTQRGWLSEQTRGHGREPIAEVLAVWRANDEIMYETWKEEVSETRVEAGIADLRSCSASILARLQSSYSELYTSLIRNCQQALKSFASKTIVFDENSDSAQVAIMMRCIVTGIEGGFRRPDVLRTAGAVFEQDSRSSPSLSKSCLGLYLGSLLNHIQGCIFEERRERVHVNMPILVALGERAMSNSSSLTSSFTTDFNFVDAIRFILDISLHDFKTRAKKKLNDAGAKNPVRQSLSRAIASCFPQAIDFLRRLLVGRSMGHAYFSPMSEILDRLKARDVPFLIGSVDITEYSGKTDSNNDKFSTGEFLNNVSLAVSDVLKTFWNDNRFSSYAPPHVVSPVTRLVLETITAIQNTKKEIMPESLNKGRPNRSNGETLLAAALGLGTDTNQPDEDFEPSADTIARMLEMGFSEDQAWDACDSTRSNSLEIAMEYALTHPGRSQEEIARRRSERAEIRRRAGNESSGSSETNQVESRPSGEKVVPMETDKPHVDSNMSKIKTKEEDKEKTKSENAIESWQSDGPKVALKFLTCTRPGSEPDAPDGDGNMEALTFISSSFLIELCNLWSNARKKILFAVIGALKDQTEEMATAITSLGDYVEVTSWQVVPGQESTFGSLCHCIVLIGRALPETFKLLLKEGVVRRVFGIVHHFSKSSFKSWPVFVSPAVLLLESMARPIVAFPAEDPASSEDDKCKDSEEYLRVREAHNEHAASLALLAQGIVSVLNPSHANSVSQRDVKTDNEPPDPIASCMEIDRQLPDQQKSSSTINPMLKSVPPFFPLLTFDTVEGCAELALALLSAKPPPAVSHALLLLLLATCRFPKISKKCFESQGVETILQLPRTSRFKGHTALVSLVFRRLVEDEAALFEEATQQIRAIILKINGGKKSSSSESKKEIIRVPQKDFMSAAKPLLLRDAFSFLRAMAITAAFEPGSSGSDGHVALLPADQRASNSIALSDLFKPDGSLPSEQQCRSTDRRTSGRRKRPSVSSTGKGKSQKRSHTPKRSKKDKTDAKERPEDPPSCHHVSAGHHVAWLLVEHAVLTSVTPMQDLSSTDGQSAVHDISRNFGYHNSFLWTADALQILGDLILCLPSCSSALLKHSRSNKHKNGRLFLDFPNALSGFSVPPRSFISYCLHCFLPLRGDDGTLDEGAVHEKSEKKVEVFFRTKVSQLSARLLMALIARAGDSRKRVISELVFALSGGLIGFSSGNSSTYIPSKLVSEFHSREISALQSWGELTLAFMAPRGNGESSLDSESAMSADVVKIMLESGAPHALLLSVHYTPLHHPSAPTAIGALLCPLEMLSRPNVAASVKSLVSLPAKGLQKSNDIPKHPNQESHNHESLRDDSLLLDDPFDQQGSAHDHDGDIVIGNAGFSQARVPEVEDNDVMDTDDEDGDDDEDDEESMETDSSASSIEDSDEDSDGDEDDDDEDDDEEEEDDDDGIYSEEDESIFDDDDDERSNEADQEFEYNPLNDAGGHVVAEGDDEQAPLFNGLFGNIQSPHDEAGWTLLGGPGDMPGGGAIQGAAGRQRNVMDAAHTMLSQILRSGELTGDTLTQLQEQLGLRIMQSSTNAPGSRLSANAHGWRAQQVSAGSRLSPSSLGGVGLIWQQQQQLGPGYARGINEVYSMEYLFGGVFSGDRHYNLATRNSSDGLPVASDAVIGVGNDVPLFPGGPIMATRVRPFHPLHPLTHGIHLPPQNSLVAEIESNGTRARVSVHPLSSARRPGSSQATYPPLLAHSGQMTFAADNGRNDYDGEIYDDSVDTFANAISESFATAISPQTHQPERESGTIDLGGDDTAETPSRALEEPPPAHQSSFSETADRVAGAQMIERTTETSQILSGDRSSDGDAVASSLANGLRLTSSLPRDCPTSRDSNAEQQEQGAPEQGNEGTMNIEDNAPTNDNENVYNSNDAAVHEMELDPDRDDEVEEAYHTQEVDVETNGSEAVPAPDEGNSAGGYGIDVNPSSEGEQNDTIECPPGADIDPSVWAVLPREMQQELADQASLDAGSSIDLPCPEGYDPDVWSALPREMREEVVRDQQRLQEHEAPADPSNAAEFDNASFVASLAPALREEILLTADDDFIQSLPPDIVGEAQILRERARAAQRHAAEEADVALQRAREDPSATGGAALSNQVSGNESDVAIRRRPRHGKIKVDCDKEDIIYVPPSAKPVLSSPLSKSDIVQLVKIFWLLSPVVPAKVLPKLFQNFCANREMRLIIASLFLNLLTPDKTGKDGASEALERVTLCYKGDDDWRAKMDKLFNASTMQFRAASSLIGTVQHSPEIDRNTTNIQAVRRRQIRDTAAQQALCLPISSKGSQNNVSLPPVVSTRILDSLSALSKSSSKFCLTLLIDDISSSSSASRKTGFESLLDLLNHPQFIKSASDLEQLLQLLELIVAPLHNLPKHEGDEEMEISQGEIDAAASENKEFLDVPRVKVSPERLRYLCSVLKMETCKESSFSRVNTIARRLCRIDANRGYVLAELGSVAKILGRDAIRDLKALAIQLSSTAQERVDTKAFGSASTSVPVSASESELRLLRVLQTLQSLCISEDAATVSTKKNGSVGVTQDFVDLLDSMALDELWDELSSCLRLVQVLEGVSMEEDANKKVAENSDDDDVEDGQADGRKKLQNSVAGILTRFLPSIESFFIATASSSNVNKEEIAASEDEEEFNSLVGGTKLIIFVEENKVLLNALIRNNAGLIDKGQMRPLIQLPQCRRHLDFDVKRHWFKTQVRRLRQQANRRYGSLRLVVRRSNVFADSYHQLRLRNSDEMRGRLHVTFRNEAGVDAGGLSRNWFSILAQEMFNPNYALFTSTEDGCTFQPNPLSSINPDHLSYFRFVGRVVGKAVSDGYLLDAHFTRSLYKHMLGIKPTHHDMEAIDPDYYKNLKTILEYNLEDLGLELTFSMEDHSFGRKRIIDLIEDGSKIKVAEENKADYVSKICEHRMTTSISNQIKAFLDGFYELVRKDLIQIFTPKELELLISGLPDIDIHDLKKNTDYVGWKSSDQQIEWFWNVMFSLSRPQKAAFVQFVTGSSKVPLGGFAELPGMRGVQKFSIHKVGGSSAQLMSAHTCFNSLDLPTYESEEQLREKLLYAITEGSGAFLMA